MRDIYLYMTIKLKLRRKSDLYFLRESPRSQIVDKTEGLLPDQRPPSTDINTYICAAKALTTYPRIFQAFCGKVEQHWQRAERYESRRTKGKRVHGVCLVANSFWRRKERCPKTKAFSNESCKIVITNFFRLFVRSDQIGMITIEEAGGIPRMDSGAVREVLVPRGMCQISRTFSGFSFAVTFRHYEEKKLRSIGANVPSGPDLAK